MERLGGWPTTCELLWGIGGRRANAGTRSAKVAKRRVEGERWAIPGPTLCTTCAAAYSVRHDMARLGTCVLQPDVAGGRRPPPDRCGK